jgi:Hypoxia induced protein conserved region
MIYVLAILLAGLMAMTLFSLIRGLNAFRESMNDDPQGAGATEMQLMQNKMMWSRIKYQGAAIAVVVVMLAMAN